MRSRLVQNGTLECWKVYTIHELERCRTVQHGLHFVAEQVSGLSRAEISLLSFRYIIFLHFDYSASSCLKVKCNLSKVQLRAG